MVVVDRSKEFESEMNAFLTINGHEKLARRTFKLDIQSDGIEFFLYTHRETGRYYSGWFSADIGVRHPLAEKFGFSGSEEYAQMIDDINIFNLAYDCAFRFSTAQIPGAGEALFDQKNNYEVELNRFQSVIRDVCIPELARIDGAKRFYEMLIYMGDDEWYGANIPREGSITTGIAVALGRMIGLDERRILKDLQSILKFFPASHVGRTNKSIDGPNYVKIMSERWDTFPMGT